MSRLDYNYFLETLTALGEYYGKQISAGVTALYFQGLNSLSNEELGEAVQKIIKERKYAGLPKVAEILEAVGVSMDERTEFALDELIRAIEKYGENISVSFKDRAIMGVVQAVGGWRKVCQMQDKEWADFKTFEFRKRYPHWAKNLQKCPLFLASASLEHNRFHNQSTENEAVALVGFNAEELSYWDKRIKLQKSGTGIKALFNQFEPVLKSVALAVEQREGAKVLPQSKGSELIKQLAEKKKID